MDNRNLIPLALVTRPRSVPFSYDTHYGLCNRCRQNNGKIVLDQNVIYFPSSENILVLAANEASWNYRL